MSVRSSYRDISLYSTSRAPCRIDLSDNTNRWGLPPAVQRAIEALGAKKDGVIRHHGVRKDGSARDTVIYSILASEWPDVKRHLELRLARHGGASG